MRTSRYWTLNGVELHTRAFHTTDKTRSPGMAAPRLSLAALPGHTGTHITGPAYLDGLEIAFEVVVYDFDQRGRRGGYRMRRENEAALKRVLAATMHEPGLLCLVEENKRREQTIRQTRAALNSSVTVEELSPTTSLLAFTLLVPYPVFEDPNVCSEAFALGEEPTRAGLMCLGGGSGPARPVYTVTGPVQSLAITCPQSGESTRWEGNIPAGHVLRIDTATWKWGSAPQDATLTLDGPQANLDQAGPIWPDPTGQYAINIDITPRGAGQTLTIEAKRAYL